MESRSGPVLFGLSLAHLVLLALMGSAHAEPKVRATLDRGKHWDGVCCVAFSPDGKTLASESFDRSIKFWDLKTGKNTATIAGRGGA